MTAYEASKRALSKGGAGLDLPPERRMLAGASAGVVGWLSIYPLDVVRSRINAQGAGGGEGGAKYTGVVDCIVKTWRCVWDLSLTRMLVSLSCVSISTVVALRGLARVHSHLYIPL